MSFLLTIEESKLEAIIDLLEKYEHMVQAAAPIFKLEGRRLEEIMRTLPRHQAEYDLAFQELKSLEEWLETIKEKRTAKYWKKYLEGYPKQLATRDIQSYIAGEKEIVEMNQFIIEVTMIKNQLASIVEAIKQMAWMTGHTTKLRVAELGDVVL